MCNRCLHIIKTSQQISWDHQYIQTYTQIVVCLYIRTHFPLPCMCVCFSKKKKKIVKNFAYNTIVYYEKDISKPNPKFRLNKSTNKSIY